MEIDLKYKNICFVGKQTNIKEFVKSINVVNTLFIIVGDTDLGFKSYEEDIYNLISCQYTLQKNNNILCIIRGNHDNPKYFRKKSSFRNELSENAPNIVLVPDYSIIRTLCHNILCIGGARSINRIEKIKNYNYWDGEVVKKPQDNFYSNLEKDKIKIDIVASHEAPLFAHPLEFSNELKHYNSYIMNSWALYDKNVKNDIYKERLLLKGIYEKLNIKNHIEYYVYGHYHKSAIYTYNKTKMISLNTNEIQNI